MKYKTIHWLGTHLCVVNVQKMPGTDKQKIGNSDLLQAEQGELVK